MLNYPIPYNKVKLKELKSSKETNYSLMWGGNVKEILNEILKQLRTTGVKEGILIKSLEEEEQEQEEKKDDDSSSDALPVIPIIVGISAGIGATGVLLFLIRKRQTRTLKGVMAKKVKDEKE